MHSARGPALVTGLLLVSALTAHGAGAFGDLNRPKDRMPGCYTKEVEWTQTEWVETRPVYQSMIEQVAASPASDPSARKRRHILDREEAMCKVEMPAIMCTVPVRVQADAGEHVLVQPGSIGELTPGGC